MNNVKKAAAFLIAVGQDAAAEILKNLDEDTVIELTTEMSRIENLTPEEREQIIGDFMVAFNKHKQYSFGGEGFVRETLVKSLGMEKAQRIYSKINTVQPESTFAFLKNVDPEIIAQLVSKEHPQTIAVLFSHIDSKIAGDVLRLLPSDIGKDVAIRLAKMNTVSPEAVMQVGQVLKKKYDEMTSVRSTFQSPGGVDRLADILNHIDPTTEHEIMQHFESLMPDTAREISEKIYTFDSVAGLTNYEVRILIDRLNDDRTISTALKGAGDEIRFKMLRNVSNNRATDIINDMDAMGPIRMSEIMEARREIVRCMRDLDDQGMIVIKKKNEQYIE
jgi:flagellar motor switch protein FliG